MMTPNPVDEITQQPFRVQPLHQVVDVVQVAAQGLRKLYQGHVIAGVGNDEGRGHPAHSAAEHQRPLERLDGSPPDGRHARHPQDGHTNQFLRLAGCTSGLPVMDPGAVLADVGHLQQVGVQPGLAHRLLEQGFVGPVTAGRHHHTVEVMFSDLAVDLRCSLWETGIGNGGCVHYPRKRGSILSDLRDIHYLRDHRATAAHKDSGSSSLPGHVSLRRHILHLAQEGELPWNGQPPQRVVVYPHHLARGARGVQDSLGYLFGRLKCPGYIDAGLAGLERLKLVRLAEPVFVEVNPQHPSQLSRPAWRLYAGRQHNHLIAVFNELAAVLRAACNARSRVAQNQIVGFRIFPDGRDATAGVLHPVRLPCFLVVLCVLFVKGPLIHHKDPALYISPNPLLGQHRLFGGKHAADGRAVGMLLVTGADTLKPGDLLGKPAVGQTGNHSLSRARAAGQPLVLHRGQHVWVPAVAELFQRGRVVHLVADRQYHGSHPNLLNPGLLLQVDGIGGAHGDAPAAIVAVRSALDDIGIRDSARR